MSHDKDAVTAQSFIEEASTEEQTERIDAIVGNEVLGYDGSGHGEHSGQTSAPNEQRVTDTLADNRPEQVK